MVSEKTASLFQDFSLKGIQLQNRMSVSPMTRISGTEDGQVTDRMVRYYERYAKGGFSLVFTEGLYPDEPHSQGYFNQPGIASEEQAAGWEPVIQAVHQHGSAIFAQLMHAGALSQDNPRTETRIAPSPVEPKGEQLAMYGGSGKFPVPQEITKQQINQVITSFANSATRARNAGFDGVEIHGANGYIVDQFLTDYTNQRTDEYGGSLTNRLRFAQEVIRAVRNAIGSDFPLSIRISQSKINDFSHQWAGGEDDAAIIFESIAEAGVDIIHITEYDATQPAFGMGLSLAGLAKKYGKLPVIANGHLEDPEKAAKLVDAGDADLITLGKGALANPDWPNRVKEGSPLKDFNSELLDPQAYIKDQELSSARYMNNSE
ncbi:NADH:flavin oxidoreductase [Barrientosiimonas marina]|uniref:NADH:flavin oxidoreductase n=1 Tax=Lentibacillus kimchii TaxID=1542911 RepID=A0ABW2UVG2_9BACI